MTDLAHLDPVLGACILTFDGRILELFSEREGTAGRMIVGLLHVTVDEPNRKGRRQISFATGPGRRGGGFTIWALEDQWPNVEAFVREVRHATGS